MKVANDVLGSVLCSPGCFSVYRAAALRDVLPIYSSKVTSSVDFLTKDMGKLRSVGGRGRMSLCGEDPLPEQFDQGPVSQKPCCDLRWRLANKPVHFVLLTDS